MKRVILVEDDETYRYLLERALREAGHYPILFNDGFGALDLLDSDEPADALIVDLRLPPGTPNGVSVAQMARARRPSLKIVLLTAHEELRAEAEARWSPVLAKSAGVEAVIAAIA